MQMGDKIVVMNHGVVEQWGTPQEIYDAPATMFVANFIGSPPMNFLRFEEQRSNRVQPRCAFPVWTRQYPGWKPV